MSASTASAPPRATREAWLLAVRPKTLPAAISPVLVGCALAWAAGAFAWLPALAAFAVALLLQIGANLANDVSDFRRGADTAERQGPLRVTQGGLISPRHVEWATAIVLAAATIPGLYLVWQAGVGLAVLGLLAIAAAVLYTGGPRPFGYLGLGELFVFIFFGPVAVIGTAYVMTKEISVQSVLAAMAMGCLITAILVVNNLRDISTDRAAGKNTLAVRLGESGTRWEYAILLTIAYVAPVMLRTSGTTEWGPMLAWVTLPLAVILIRAVWRSSGKALNPILAGTARLCLWFAVALSVGLIL